MVHMMKTLVRLRKAEARLRRITEDNKYLTKEEIKEIKVMAKRLYLFEGAMLERLSK